MIFAHIFFVLIGMSGALIADALFSFYAKDRNFSQLEIHTLTKLSRVIQISLLGIVFSGIFIFLTDIEGYLASSKFLSKMTILAILMVNGYILNTYVWSHILGKGNLSFFAPNQKKVRQVAFVGGAISIVSWIAVLILGLSDAVPYTYDTILRLYASAVFLASAIALLVESFEFEGGLRRR